MNVCAASLNSNDAYLLKMPGGTAYLWMGKGASEEEEKASEYLSKMLDCISKRILEGQEPGHHLYVYIKSYVVC